MAARSCVVMPAALQQQQQQQQKQNQQQQQNASLEKKHCRLSRLGRRAALASPLLLSTLAIGSSSSRLAMAKDVPLFGFKKQKPAAAPVQQQPQQEAAAPPAQLKSASAAPPAQQQSASAAAPTALFGGGTGSIPAGVQAGAVVSLEVVGLAIASFIVNGILN